MFCRQCGKELEEGAHFCAFCGTKVHGATDDDSPLSSAQTPKTPAAHSAHADGELPHAPESPATPVASTRTAVAAEEPSLDAFAAPGAESSNDTPEATSADASSTQDTTLKAAVKATRKRSLRKMPMILLVALALALATSLAFAAYQVYTKVWVPYQQAQSQEQEQGSTQDDNNTAATSEYVDVWVVDEKTETWNDSPDTAYTTTSYEYDSSGRLTTETTLYYTEDGSMNYSTVWTYSYDGPLLAARIVGEDTTTEYLYTYNEQGQCIQFTAQFEPDTTSNTTFAFEYDAEGRIATINETDASGDSATYSCLYGNDPEGTAPSFTVESQTNSTSSSLNPPEQYYDYSATYDDYGNIVSAQEPNGDIETSYQYKRISVKADEWIPNPYSNPTLGAGDLTNYSFGFSYYSLKPDRIEEIMTANE